MTILEISDLVDATVCYDYARLIINLEDVRNLLMMLKERYSIFLFNVVNKMLDANPENRPSFTDLLGVLRPYER